MDFDFVDNRRFWFFLEHAFFIKELLVVDRRLFEKKFKKLTLGMYWKRFFGGFGGGVKTMGDEP